MVVHSKSLVNKDLSPEETYKLLCNPEPKEKSPPKPKPAPTLPLSNEERFIGDTPDNLIGIDRIARDEVREDVTRGFHAILERYDELKRKAARQVLQELINKEVERKIIENDQIKFVSTTDPPLVDARQTIWGASEWAGLGSDKPKWAREPQKRKRPAAAPDRSKRQNDVLI